MINKLIFTLSFFLLVAGAKAQNEIGVSLRDFSGGINNNAASIALKANESPDAKNVIIDEPWGQVKTRNGSLTCGSIPSGNTITNVYEYIRANGTHELILTDNTNIYTTIDCVNVSTIVAGLSSVANPYFDTFFDKLWITNKSTHVYTWDGTTLNMLDGTGGEPNPPLFQYITHFKERVFGARTPTEPSAVYFTDLTDPITGTNLDPSVSSTAWNTLNAIYVAQEDGSPIYGIKVYRDSLFVFKETGIWRIVFESSFDINIVKSVSNVGCRFQDSIVELDNFLYFVGPDGIYKFDGNDAVRISDNIQAYFNLLKQPSARDAYRLWDSASDFIAGTIDINVSTSITDGSVSLMYEDFADLNYTKNPVWTSTGPYSATCISTNGYVECDGNALLYTNSTEFDTWSARFYRTAGKTFRYLFAAHSIPNLLTSKSYDIIVDASGNLRIWRDGGAGLLCVSSNTLPSDAWQTMSITRSISGLFSVSVGTITCSATDNTYSSSTIAGVFINGTGVYVDDFTAINKSTGVFTSEIITASSLSAWRTFDIDETLNGQTINYYVRTGTSSYNTGLATWTAINSGNVISTTTNQYFQWKAELVTADTSKTPLVDAVTANYREGDVTATRLQMINYKNRLYLTGSTTPANNFNDFVLVKTKYPLDNWIPYDWNISAFSKWNNYLYGGISESANVARFDYGTNDNGRAINAYWSWGDQHWDRMSYKKNLKEIYAFYLPTQSSANTYIGYSIDGGTTWTDKTVNMTGTSAFGTKKMNNVGGIGNAIRVRVGNNTLDQSFNVLGLDLWALPYINRE